MNPRQIAVLVFSIPAVIPAMAAQDAAPKAQTGAAAVAPSQEGKRPVVRASQSAAPDADARSCLQYPTNLQVMVCAEKYRPKRRDA